MEGAPGFLIRGLRGKGGSRRRDVLVHRTRMSKLSVIGLMHSAVVTHKVRCSTGETDPQAMSLRIRSLAAAALLGIAAPSTPSAQQPKPCLAGVCLRDLHVTEGAVLRALGPGSRVKRPDDTGHTRCYFDAESGVWADFTFAGSEEAVKRGTLRSIMITEEQQCSRESTSKVALRRTLGPVSIGMNLGEVTERLGKPSRVDDARARENRNPALQNSRYAARYGDTVYVYDASEERGFLFVYFRDQRVRTIWFSDGE